MDIMIDLETLGTSSNAAITALGAVAFSVEDGIIAEFYAPIDLESSMAAGGIVDASTILWWFKQDKAALEHFNDPDRKTLKEALRSFKVWYKLLKTDMSKKEYDNRIRIWGNGAGFDNVVLFNAYRSVNIDAPWKFYDDRCYRTMKELFGDIADHASFDGTKHNALDDARAQAIHLIDMIKALEGL